MSTVSVPLLMLSLAPIEIISYSRVNDLVSLFKMIFERISGHFINS